MGGEKIDDELALRVAQCSFIAARIGIGITKIVYFLQEAEPLGMPIGAGTPFLFGLELAQAHD
jgi:hypothetical protein